MRNHMKYCHAHATTIVLVVRVAKISCLRVISCTEGMWMRARALRGKREFEDAPRWKSVVSSNGDQFQGSRGDRTRQGAERGARPRGVQPEPEHRLACLRGWPRPCECACPSTPRQEGAKCAGTPSPNKTDETDGNPPKQTVPNPTLPCQTLARGKTRLSAPASGGDTRFPRVHWRTAEQTRSHGSSTTRPHVHIHTPRRMVRTISLPSVSVVHTT